MIKIKLEPFEVQLACDVATRRFIKTLKWVNPFLMAMKDLLRKQLH